ncbi:MAG: NAD(P)H-quinone oxidoreductase [Sphingomonadaceae bacterium]
MRDQQELPHKMRAIDPELPGGPEVLAVVDRPVPLPGVGEVLIRVHAAGVNRPDVVQRQGHYPPPAGSTSILGLEASGVVVALGEGVGNVRIGDPVTALLPGGGYADYVVANEKLCLPVPAGMHFLEAAALPETYFTVWSNLFRVGGAKAGDTLLIHGGTSGIGVAAIDLGRVFGIMVIVTCGTDAKCRAAEKLGAALAINYRSGDFAPRVREFTEGRGVDLVIDMVGGNYVGRNLVCLAENGRHISIAFQQGRATEIDLSLLMRKRLHLTGTMLRPRPLAEKAAIADDLREKVWPHFAEGRLQARIDQIVPMENAASAHRRMEAGDHIGKLVLSMM